MEAARRGKMRFFSQTNFEVNWDRKGSRRRMQETRLFAVRNQPLRNFSISPCPVRGFLQRWRQKGPTSALRFFRHTVFLKEELPTRKVCNFAISNGIPLPNHFVNQKCILYLQVEIATVPLNGSGSTLTRFSARTGSIVTALDWNRFYRFGSNLEPVMNRLEPRLQTLTGAECMLGRHTY